MQTVQLQVGKTYKTRTGKADVKIIGRLPESDPIYTDVYPFLGDDGVCYTSDGRYNELAESTLDLTCEVVDDNTVL